MMDRSSWHGTGHSDQDHYQEKEMQKGKMVVWGGLKTAVKRREVKNKGEKERYIHLNAEFQGIASLPQWSVQSRGKQWNGKE